MKKSIFELVLLFFFISVFSIIFVIYNYGLPSKNIENKKIIKVKKECVKDNDCLPQKLFFGVKYICQNNKCQKQIISSPASINCQEKGGKLELKYKIKNKSYGVCVFPDGSECEEWLFLEKKCLPGDFNPNDDIWEGSVIENIDGKYDDYFKMINGENVGIDSKNVNIKNILFALKNKDNKIKVKGIIQKNVDDYNKQQLIVNDIIDLGGIVFKKISQEDSEKLAKKKLKEDKEYIKNKGSKIVLIEIKNITCPYCWNFVFTYLTKKGEIKFVEISVQEGKVKDIFYLLDEKYKNCDEFSLIKVCTKQYNPVCAQTKENMIWKTFTNSCQACLVNKLSKKTIWYKRGECQK